MSDAAKPRVLYVDDDPEHRRLFSAMLRKDFDVAVAGDGGQALELLRDEGPFAVMMSDMRMPGMNGCDLLSRARAESAHTVRVLLTGDADLDSAMRAVNEAGAFRYLTKPCPSGRLISELKAAVGHHEQELERDGLGKQLDIATDQSPLDLQGGDAELYVGMVIAGRYRVESVVGVGGTAAVFRCHDRVLGCEVALKLFPRGLSAEAQERVRRELRLTRELSHPNLIRCFCIGTHAGHPFITMELLHGTDLRETISRGPMSLDSALECLIQACHGVEHAHRMGVTHRDLKPENLLRTPDGVLHVMDFGLAKRKGERGITAPNTLAGTVQYMSPEQIQDFSRVGPLTDVYALGVVGYELVTGLLPFDDAEMMAVITAHLTRDPVPPSLMRPGLPDDLDHVLLTALAKDPRDRFQSCAALARALQEVKSRHTSPRGVTGLEPGAQMDSGHADLV